MPTDAVRHFLDTKQKESDVAQFIREELQGKHVKRGYSAKEIEENGRSASGQAPKVS